MPSFYYTMSSFLLYDAFFFVMRCLLFSFFYVQMLLVFSLGANPLSLNYLYHLGQIHCIQSCSSRGSCIFGCIFCSGFFSIIVTALLDILSRFHPSFHQFQCNEPLTHATSFGKERLSSKLPSLSIGISLSPISRGITVTWSDSSSSSIQIIYFL